MMSIENDGLSVNKSKFSRQFKGIFIEASIWLEKGLSLIEKCLWAEIDSLFCEHHGGCYANNEYLADFIGIKERTLRDALAKLRAVGLIEDISFDGRTRVIKAIPISKDLSSRLAAWREAAMRQGGGKPPRKLAGCRQVSLYRDTTLDTNTPIVPKTKNAAKAASVGVSSSSKSKKKKEEHTASDKAKEILPKFIQVIKSFDATYVVSNQNAMLASIDEMLTQGRTEDLILKVLAWGVKDNMIKGEWNGWSSKILGSKNPAGYLKIKFQGIKTASEAKKERKFAPCSDDAAAEASFDRMATL